MPHQPTDHRLPITAPEPIRRAVLAAVDLIWAAVVEEMSGHREAIDQVPVAVRMRSARELLEDAGLPTDRETLRLFDKRLARFRERHFDCYRDHEPLERSEPDYMYFSDRVASVVEAFRFALRSKIA